MTSEKFKPGNIVVHKYIKDFKGIYLCPISKNESKAWVKVEKVGVIGVFIHNLILLEELEPFKGELDFEI